MTSGEDSWGPVRLLPSREGGGRRVAGEKGWREGEIGKKVDLYKSAMSKIHKDTPGYDARGPGIPCPSLPLIISGSAYAPPSPLLGTLESKYGMYQAASTQGGQEK